MKELIIEALRKGYVTRAELCDAFGCTDIQARTFIRSLRLQGIPIVSTAARKGYHIVQDVEELESAKAAYQELRAKAIGIMEAAKPLRRFIKEKGENPDELLPFPVAD